MEAGGPAPRAHQVTSCGTMTRNSSAQRRYRLDKIARWSDSSSRGMAEQQAPSQPGEATRVTVLAAQR